MNRYVLDQEVQMCGRDFFGRSTSVMLRPVYEPGWYWQAGNDVVPLSRDLLVRRRRRLALVHKKYELNVFEHLGALRFSGLDSVLIVSESPWLPHDGSAGIFWNAVKPHLRQAGILAPFAMNLQQIFNSDRSVCYTPCGGSLAVSITVSYPELPIGRYDGSFPSWAAFDEIAPVKTQGWPQWMRSVAIAAGACGWPHRHHWVWPQEHTPGLVSALFAQHRAVDLLGALSVVCPPGSILTGSITSVCAGHALDVDLVHHLRPLVSVVAA